MRRRPANPLGELARFLRAALVVPTPRDHLQSDAAFRRRRVVSVATLVVGAGVLAWSLRLPPGDPRFYLLTVVLAGVWICGALLSGPLHLGRAWTRSGTPVSRAVVQSAALGGLLAAIFLAGALVVAHLAVLRAPVQHLLAYADAGRLPIVIVITALNGVAEEFYFRGALYAAIGRRHAVGGTTVVYLAVTAAAGVPLLTFAAAVLGVVTALQRRVTGGILGPVITHLIWSLSMLLLLPRILGVAS